jgi:predicted esterase YcpF (UPF0227 family)
MQWPSLFKVQFFYLHGFNSGFDPSAKKIRDLSQLGQVVGATVNYLDLKEVISLELKILEAVEQFDGETILVGTSLGGYFARYFSEKIGLRAIVMNPAVDPHLSLTRAIGEQTNYFTQQKYVVTPGGVQLLERYQTEHPYDTLMILATDDEVIPYKKAIERYGATSKTVLTTGGHRMEDLNKVLGEIQRFINRLPAHGDKV